MAKKPLTRRERLHEIIFGADTPAGKTFDVALMVLIIASVLAVILESVSWIHDEYGAWLRAFEWMATYPPKPRLARLWPR